ncbi:MAG TPA: glycosyltransferase family 4 protein [Candidatus Angelobacter sp.]|jgi:glycosyltransferase involved in cell wall biosynthesis|nr:glycosyltransferase family 4 protein [Candidatus Angelobacter sp.]
MRILYCNKYNFPFSGTEVYMFELMDLMRAQGHEVALFSMADPRGLPTPYDEYFLPNINFKSLPHGWFARAKLAAHAIYSTEARRRLRQVIAAFRPEVAHVRNIYHHLSPSILWELKAQSVPVLYHLNDFKLLCPTYNMVSKGRVCERCRGGRFRHVLTEGCYAGPPGSALFLMAEAYFHRWLGTYQKCVDQFLAPSRFAKEKLVQNGFNAQKITVLPHFQKLPAQAPPPFAPQAPILYFGRLSPEKGITDLLLAMKDLPQVRLLIAGDGPQRLELENLARGLGLKNVEFTGHVGGKVLEQMIASARFTVLPSRAYETLGKTILESYAWGRPVVASDLGSRRELIEQGETGLLYPSGNVEQLQKAISFLAERPEIAAQMGIAGRRFVEAQHAPQAHYRALMRLYTQMRPWPGRAKKPATPPATVLPLHVAFIGGRGMVSKYSGIETYYEEVGKRLVEMGHDVTVYCRSYFTPPMSTHEGMRLLRLPTFRSKHLETFVHTWLSTVHVMFSGCDIVHYHAQGPALFSFFPRLVGKKTVVTVQGQDWQRKKWGRFAALTLRLGEVASARLPNRTMVVSQALRRHYRTAYGVDATYVPNGSMIRQRVAPSQISDWGLEPDNYILFLGRFSPEKNCHLLIEAYEKLDTSAKLVLAGGSSYTNAYVDELRTHQSEKVVFLDWVHGPALDELLTNAALFVLPSDLEGLSLALLDAMGAAVCVLTSDIPENREVIEDTGFTFQPGDATDLERMLRFLLSDAHTRTIAGRKAQARVQEHYLWPRIATQIAHSYVELTDRETAVEYPQENAPARETSRQVG